VVASSQSPLAVGSVTFYCDRIQAVTASVLGGSSEILADNRSAKDLGVCKDSCRGVRSTRLTCSNAMIYARSNLNFEIIGKASFALGY
jgi:hypothetical protein